MANSQAIPTCEVSQVEYRDIAGFPGYRVGDDGSVWYCWKRGWQNQRYLSSEWKPMVLAQNEKGYLRVNLVPPGGKSYKTLKVHRLVLEAFVGPCPNGMECRHLNSIRTDCRLENLQWGTRSCNQQDIRDRNGYKKGQDSGRSKLTDDAVAEIRRKYATGMFVQRELAAEFGIGASMVSHIVNRKNWTHLS